MKNESYTPSGIPVGIHEIPREDTSLEKALMVVKSTPEKFELARTTLARDTEVVREEGEFVVFHILKSFDAVFRETLPEKLRDYLDMRKSIRTLEDYREYSRSQPKAIQLLAEVNHLLYGTMSVTVQVSLKAGLKASSIYFEKLAKLNKDTAASLKRLESKMLPEHKKS